MDLGNLVQTEVHHLLIGGTTCLSHRDGFSMVSLDWFVLHREYTSVCDAHWIGPMVNHVTRLSIITIHQPTILHGLSDLR